MRFASLLALALLLSGCSTRVVDEQGSGGSGGTTIAATSGATTGGAGGGGGAALTDQAWSRSFGAPKRTTGSLSLGVDAAHEVFVTTVETNPKTNTVTRVRARVFDRAGDPLSNVPTSLPDYPSAAVPGGGGVFTGGVTGTASVFGQSVTCTPSCAYVAQTAASGEAIWVHTFPISDGGQLYVRQVAVAPGGDVIASGDFLGTTDLGEGPVAPPPQDESGFVVALDAGGNPLWSRRFDAEAVSEEALSVNTAGETLVVGSFWGTIDFGDGNPPTTAWSEGNGAFLAKLDVDGALTFTKAIVGDGFSTNVPGGLLDNDGNVYVTGSFRGQYDFGGGPGGEPDTWSSLVVKYGGDGSFGWLATLDTTQDIRDFPVLAVAADGLWCGSSLYGAATLGGETYTPHTDADALLVHFDAEGVATVKQFGDAGGQDIYALAPLDDGSLAIAGPFTSRIDFGQGPLVAVGGVDTFVARLFP